MSTRGHVAGWRLVILALTFALVSTPLASSAQTGATTYNLHSGSITLPAGSACHVVLETRGRLGSWTARPTLRGMRLSAIRSCFGEPTSRTGATVFYRFVDGGDCYWGTELRLTVRGGRVRRAETRRYSTGMHCQMEF